MWISPQKKIERKVSGWLEQLQDHQGVLSFKTADKEHLAGEFLWSSWVLVEGRGTSKGSRKPAPPRPFRWWLNSDGNPCLSSPLLGEIYAHILTSFVSPSPSPSVLERVWLVMVTLTVQSVYVRIQKGIIAELEESITADPGLGAVFSLWWETILSPLGSGWTHF